MTNQQPKQVGELLSKPPQRKQPVELTELEIDLVDYVFHMIRITWSPELFKREFKTDQVVFDKKRSFAHDILKAIGTRQDSRETQEEFIFRKKGKVDRVFSEIRQLADSPQNRAFDFPNLLKITRHMANYRDRAEHRAHVAIDYRLESDEATRGRKRSGANELTKMKNLFP